MVLTQPLLRSSSVYCNTSTASALRVSKPLEPIIISGYCDLVIHAKKNKPLMVRPSSTPLTFKMSVEVYWSSAKCILAYSCSRVDFTTCFHKMTEIKWRVTTTVDLSLYSWLISPHVLHFTSITNKMGTMKGSHSPVVHSDPKEMVTFCDLHNLLREVNISNEEFVKQVRYRSTSLRYT